MPVAAEGFLRSVLRSGLLDREQLASALRGLRKESLNDPQEVANHLVQAGKLSPFQAHKLLRGATLGLKLGPYHILAPVGKGGMGAVYLALDTRSGTHRAVKVLPPKRARAEDRYLARFQREMELSRKVSHPHIAQTHEAGVFQGVYYLAMEYIPGRSLFRLVTSEGPLDVRRAARLFAEVAAALEHAHGLGLIHRDLKPSNIMVTPNDHAKILDFGLALMEGEVSGEVEVIGGRGYVVGSVDYMAPEQTHDATQVDPRSDLYAMGCCLYFALTGRPPFPGGKTRDKVNAHRSQEPESVQARNAWIPDGFAQLVHKLMAKKPEERFASAAAARAALLAWSAEEVLPVESEGDQVQRAAIAAAVTRAAADDLRDEPVLAEIAPEQVVGLEEAAPLLPAELFEEQEKSEMLGIVLGLAAFWVIVVVVLLVIMMFR